MLSCRVETLSEIGVACCDLVLCLQVLQNDDRSEHSKLVILGVFQEMVRGWL